MPDHAIDPIITLHQSYLDALQRVRDCQIILAYANGREAVAEARAALTAALAEVVNSYGLLKAEVFADLEPIALNAN